MPYEVKLDQFEGSLDLLLYLIRSNKVNIYDIPISTITDQYLFFIKTWQEMNLDIASEFIVLASRLIEIKSQMLLPRNHEGNEEDPRKELVSQLIDYQIIKSIGEYFKERYEIEQNVFYRDPEELPQSFSDEPIDINAEEIKRVINRLFAVYKADHTFWSDEQDIVRDAYTVEDKILKIKTLMKKNNSFNFFSIFDNNQSISEVIVSFQAILELCKTGEIEVIQDQSFGDIMILQGEH